MSRRSYPSLTFQPYAQYFCISGELIDKDGGDLVSAYRSNGSPPAADSGRGIKAGSPRGELERRASVSAVTAGLGTSDKTSGVEQRKEGAAWGKRWETHF